MPGFSTRADLITEGYTNGKLDYWTFEKVSTAPEAAGVMHSLWTAAGSPRAGAAPAGTPGAAYDMDQSTSFTNTAGGMWFPDRSTDQKHLIEFNGTASAACSLILYDRLVGVGSVSLSAPTGSKTVNSAALTRYTGSAAVANEVWLEVTVASTSAPVVNIDSYTSSDGSATLVGGAVTFPAAVTNVDTIVQLPLHDAEAGVRSVESINLTTAGAATANLLIVRRLATIPLLAGVWTSVNFLDDVMGLPRVFDNAALGLAILSTGTTAVTLSGEILMAYG